MQGLARARAVLADRTKVARDAQQKGTRVLGYLSVQVPLEILTAFDIAPFRIFGDIREPVTEADRGLPSAFCPYLRSVLDLALKGRFGFLDGFVGSHACDAQEKTVRILPSLVEFPYTHYLDMPANIHESSIEYFRTQLLDFKDSLESLTGRTLSERRLLEAIGAHNDQRGLVRELYALNQSDPPALTGREMLEVITALQTLPVDEGNRLLREVLPEVKTRRERPASKSARLLVWGGVLHDPVYIDAIEAAGANVVIDDLDEGTRPFTTDVAAEGDLFDHLARKYLVGVYAARTFRESVVGETVKDHATDLQSRFGYLGRFIKDWKVDAVILQAVRYCDPHGADVVDLTDYLESLGVPSTYVEHNYSEGALAPLRTRLEAFVETVS
ncbi:MAG: 2-hydroxyacyl-CoA dehydratase [Deltaproteobacteria bacterium]|nr:2-hydroxyacyl-CoA dehydratase [Deltaproteobacteria bacterium]